MANWHPTRLAAQGARAQFAAFWSGLRPPERRVITWALTALAAVLIWTVALQPAWRVLTRAPSTLAQLERELQSMRLLAAEAVELRAVAPLRVEAANAALDKASASLGDKIKLRARGDRITATLAGVGASELRQWLLEVRSGARARILEVELTRDDGRFSGRVELIMGGGSPP